MTTLSDRMRLLADKVLERADELRKAAAEFDAASAGFYAQPQTHDVKQMMGSWARARKLLHEITGEPLV